MKIIYKWMFLYYWTKAEEAYTNGNNDKYLEYCDKSKKYNLKWLGR